MEREVTNREWTELIQKFKALIAVTKSARESEHADEIYQLCGNVESNMALEEWCRLHLPPQGDERQLIELLLVVECEETHTSKANQREHLLNALGYNEDEDKADHEKRLYNLWLLGDLVGSVTSMSK